MSRELLKPEMEPVAFMQISKAGTKENIWFSNPGLCDDEIALGDKIIPLYIHPPVNKKPLSEEQAGNIFCNQCKSDDWLDLVRAIEKAHGIE